MLSFKLLFDDFHAHTTNSTDYNEVKLFVRKLDVLNNEITMDKVLNATSENESRMRYEY